MYEVFTANVGSKAAKSTTEFFTKTNNFNMADQFVKWQGDKSKVKSHHTLEWINSQEKSPRKKSGLVSYHFKRETTYPARIYVFMHSELWCPRNLRPMGLLGSMPFLKRSMSIEEIEYHHFDHRLAYYQYENWERLLSSEAKEAEVLNKELGNSYGDEFLTQLKSFKKSYMLKGPGLKPKVAEVLQPSIIKTIFPLQLQLFL